MYTKILLHCSNINTDSPLSLITLTYKKKANAKFEVSVAKHPGRPIS